MHAIRLLTALLLLNACGIPTIEKAGLKFSTQLSPVPAEMAWQDIGFAKELINQSKQLVVVSGGDNPVPLDEWDAFTPPGFPGRRTSTATCCSTKPVSTARRTGLRTAAATIA